MSNFIMLITNTIHSHPPLPYTFVSLDKLTGMNET